VDALKKAALAAAALFGLRQIQRFATEAFRAGEAIAAGQRQLEQQLANTGVAWSDVRGEIKETARALWDTHRLTAGEVDQTLRQLIVVTNDYETSLRAVGLVHDIVAATGLGVEQSTRLLGRAMNGDINVFNRYGVAIDGTRDVLEQLTERFAGAAKAGTSASQTLTKAWSDFKEQIGLVMIEAGRGASILDTLSDAVRAMTDWVERNTHAFVMFFDYGIVPVARGLKMLAQAVVGVAKVFTGVLFGVLSAGAHGLSLLASAAALAERAKARFLGLFSPERAAAAHRQADAIQANARALREWAKAAQEVGRETVLEGLFPGTPERGEGREGRTPPALRAGGAGSADETEGRTAATDKEADALARLEEQREALIAQMSREIEVHGRRAEAIRQGEEAVEALNRQLHIEEAVLRSGAEAGSDFEATIRQLAAAQYDAAQAAEQAAMDVESAWTNAAEAIEAEISGLTQSLGGMFLAWASAGIKGVARFAKAKVLENVAWAIENVAKAIANPFASAKHLAAAKQHGVAAAKWGAVAGAAAAGGSGGAGGGGPSVGGPSSGPAERSTPRGPEVNIHFVGPGFSAVNPQVQKIVYGAMQEARTVYGPDAKINVHQGG
jgi:hypothetical protein